MFDFDAGKLLIVGVIALIFIPPKDLPRVLRQAGQFVGRMRRMAAEFQGQFMDAMREADMADIRREAQKLAESARIDARFDSVHDLDRQMVAKRPAGADGLSHEAWPHVEVASPPEVAPSPEEPPSSAPRHAPEVVPTENAIHPAGPRRETEVAGAPQHDEGAAPTSRPVV